MNSSSAPSAVFIASVANLLLILVAMPPIGAFCLFLEKLVKPSRLNLLLRRRPVSLTITSSTSRLLTIACKELLRELEACILVRRTPKLPLSNNSLFLSFLFLPLLVLFIGLLGLNLGAGELLVGVGIESGTSLGRGVGSFGFVAQSTEYD